MPLETKKILWTVFSVLIVLVVVTGVAIALVFPKNNTNSVPASVSAVIEQRQDNPEEYTKLPIQTQEQEEAASVVAEALQEKPIVDEKALEEQAGTEITIIYNPETKPEEQVTETKAPEKKYVPIPAKPKEVETKTKTTTKAKASPKPVVVTEYWIQASAFTSKTKADDLQRQLATKGLSSVIILKDIDGKTWYRVRIGPYNTDKEAKEWLPRVKTISTCEEAYVSRQSIQK